MNQKLQQLLDSIQQSGHLSFDEKAALAKKIKEVDKEIEITSFKLERTEKVKRTTAVLLEETIEELEQKRKAIEETYRELEIESSLERVRTVAMSMSKPDNLLNIAESVFKELQGLGFTELRNAIIQTFVDDKKYFKDYDFSDVTGGWISSIPYTGHPIIEKFVKNIRKNSNVFVETVISGKEMEEWMAFRKSNGEVNDPRLDGIQELFYYHYSIGEGDIGISTFCSINAEKQNLLKRFRNVFDLAYQRYTDIQKAEEQAREAQIETALERVRSRSLAMHKSDELNEVVSVLFERLKDLHIPFTAVGLAISIEGSKDLNAFVCGENEAGLVITNYRLPSFDNKISNDLNKVLENRLDYFVGHYSKEEKDAFYIYVLEHTPEFRQLPENIKRIIFDSASYTVSMMAVNKAIFNINDFEGKVLADDEVDIIKRFARVFDQAYTRFLDLQKAEAQTREARIETALEKVRGRSLAMHHSDELNEVVNTVLEQLKILQVSVNSASIYIFRKGSKDWEQWVSSSTATYSTFFYVPYADYQIFKDLEEARQTCKEFYSKKYSKKDKNEWFDHACKHSNYSQIPTLRKKFIRDSKCIILSFALGKNTSLQIAKYADDSFSDQENEIIKRFSKVFEQSYTRFLDLQKAEAQAREAQIETALERVRSRTMAMHSSNELIATAELLYDQINQLGAESLGVAFGICNHDSGMVKKWTNIGIFSIPSTAESGEQKMYEAWRNQDEIYEETYEGEKIKKYYETFMEFPAFREGFQKVLDKGYPLPTWQKNHAAIFKYGYLLFITTKPFKETNIFIRFAKVFEQTYTRFLDLQKAEAQTREAQIETCLERVRSKSLAMHHTTELQEVIHTVHKELLNLNIAISGGSFIVINNDIETTLRCWGSGGTANTSEEVILPLYQKPFCTNLINGIKKGQGFFTEVFTLEEKIEFFTFLFKNEPWSKLDAKQQQETLSSPGGYTRSCAVSMHTSIFIINHFGKLFSEDENDILKRFAKVFEQTYTRFLDLKNAEAREVIAVREASLDRVRGEIASMRTAEDLQRITPLVWRELTALGVPFFRCGLFIVDEPAEVIHFYLSTPDGKPLAALELPFQGINVTKEAIANWRLQKVYTTHWSKEEFIAFAKNLLDRGQIKNTSTYLGGSEAPESLTLQFVPFKQGMLYVGSVNVLNELQIESVKVLANAFSTAYARYEDFIKLESAKQQIEKTLEELKATQKQLIQSEKMASLGELTAGIAHEIQNPLNFVNNFSEVSTELLDEMNVEIAKGNLEDAKQIAEDLKQNLQKINHHGKRAGDIVKGMLQHSRSTSNATKEPTDINKLADEYLRLAYHGLRAKDKSFNATMKTDFDNTIGNINVIPQDIGRVILNLITNAFYAVDEKKKSGIEGYEPTVSISTKKENNKVLITVKDNGNGIPQKILDKIFQPFYTTKPTGQGTGLGLSLSYDIVKAHGGELKVETREARPDDPVGRGEGSEFIIQLPV